MLTENLAVLFERDIQKLKTEINAYADETKLWITVPGTSNPGGNLCLHLAGNLQHYIGGVLGNSGYLRDRPKEFSDKDIPVPALNGLIDHTASVVVKTIRSLDNKTLANNYPEKVFEYEMTTEYFLLHLLAHLNYHLGQINYHRRMSA
ncbi:MAG: DinB family protein [Bacteroidota bacterium]